MKKIILLLVVFVWLPGCTTIQIDRNLDGVNDGISKFETSLNKNMHVVQVCMFNAFKAVFYYQENGVDFRDLCSKDTGEYP